MMYYVVVKGQTKYIAMAKEVPFTSDSPHPLYEPGELWFDIGSTPEKALANLKLSLQKEGKNIDEQ